MRILGLLLLLTITSANSWSQSVEKFTPYLLELGNNLDAKSMSKTWKKTATAWNANVSAATDYEQIKTLTIELKTALGSSGMDADFAKSSTKWESGLGKTNSTAQYAAYLIQLEDGIDPDAKLEEWTNRQGEWQSELIQLSLDVAAESQKISIPEQEFETPFNRIWADINIGFKNITAGEPTKVPGVGEAWMTTIKMPRAKQNQIIKVQEDDSYVLQYVSVWDCGTFVANAEDVKKQITAHLDKYMPADFPMTTTYWSGYKDSKKQLWELASDDFTKQAKNPSVTLGIIEQKGKYIVELRIIEPVFK